LKRLGIRDLDDTASATTAESNGHGARILIIGFFRTASSLLEELRRTRQDLMSDIAVVDFNPVVHQSLHRIGVKAIYGDISQPDTLRHAGVANAEILVCTIPDTLLKGTTNLKLVRQLREMNPEAMIVTVAELLDEIPALYDAGACYVSVARLDEAADLCEVLQAVDCGLIDDKCSQLHKRLDKREEVLP
jgi:voltage-gated potassium channel Kch